MADGRYEVMMTMLGDAGAKIDTSEGSTFRWTGVSLNTLSVFASTLHLNTNCRKYIVLLQQGIVGYHIT